LGVLFQQIYSLACPRIHFASNSAASVTGVACFGNALSILGQVAIGSSFSVQSFVRLGFAVSVDADIFAHDRRSVAAGIQAVGVLSTSAAMLADTCRASTISAVVHGNAISISSATRRGDSLSLCSFAQLGSSLSVRDAVMVGGAFSTYEQVGIRTETSIAGYMLFGSALSVRNTAVVGDFLSVFGELNAGSSLSVSSFTRMGSSLSVEKIQSGVLHERFQLTCGFANFSAKALPGNLKDLARNFQVPLRASADAISQVYDILHWWSPASVLVFRSLLLASVVLFFLPLHWVVMAAGLAALLAFSPVVAAVKTAGTKFPAWQNRRRLGTAFSFIPPLTPPRLPPSCRCSLWLCCIPDRDSLCGPLLTVWVCCVENNCDGVVAYGDRRGRSAWP
jgi:hypothetical protein